MPRFSRILLYFALLGAFISLSLAVQQPAVSQAARIGGYACLALLVLEFAIVAAPKAPAFFRRIFAVKYQPFRVSVSAVLAVVVLYVTQRYGYDSQYINPVAFSLLISGGWLILEVVFWIAGYGLTPTSPPEATKPSAKPELPPYVPDPPGDLDTDDGLALFRKFINTLDDPSSDNKEV